MIQTKAEDLEKLVLTSSIQRDLLLAPLTTFRIGGKAQFFSLIEDRDDLRRVLQFCAEEDFPLLILGGGSNLLISDEGFPGLVLKLGRNFQTVQVEKNIIIAFTINLTGYRILHWVVTKKTRIKGVY